LYGSLAGVAALSKQWTDAGEFTDAGCLDCLQELETNPTKSEVVSWLDQVSNAMDTALAGAGFVTPVTNITALGSITLIINQYVADLVKYANNTGRFATERARESGVEPFITIDKNIIAWVTAHAAGLEAAGVPRIAVRGNKILTRDNTPIFSRKMHGNEFQNWTKDADV
jgi:hypothetical protein